MITLTILTTPITRQGKKAITALQSQVVPALLMLNVTKQANLQVSGNATLSVSKSEMLAIRTNAASLGLTVSEYCLYGLHMLGRQNSAKFGEKWWQEQLQKELGGAREVKCPAGYIDLLTDKEVIEVKYSQGWKGAIGQAIAYSVYYPAKSPAIALIGEPDLACKHVCEALGLGLYQLSELNGELVIN